MKQISPLERYDEDQEYPSTADLETEASSARRRFLKGLLAGAAALGSGLWLADAAQAQPSRPKLLPPGVPPRPHPGMRPRPQETPAIPGGGPLPQPPPPTGKRPCAAHRTTVPLDAVFAFCDGRYGKLEVTTADPAVAEMLRKPGEGRRLAPVIGPLFAQERSCAWLDRPPRIAQVESRLAKALTDAYQQALGILAEPLKVRLKVRPREIRLGGV